MHYDGTGWTREPLEVGGGFEILAVDAVAGDQAWLLGRDARRSARPARAHRGGRGARVGAAAARAARGGHRTARRLRRPADRHGRRAVDRRRSCPAQRDITLYRAHGGGGATTSWCDGGACDRPLGSAFSREQGYVLDRLRRRRAVRRARDHERPPAGRAERPTTAAPTSCCATTGSSAGRAAARRTARRRVRRSRRRLARAGRCGSPPRPPPQRLRGLAGVAVRAPLDGRRGRARKPRRRDRLGRARRRRRRRGRALRAGPGLDARVPAHRQRRRRAPAAARRRLARAGRAHAVGDLGAMWMWRAGHRAVGARPGGAGRLRGQPDGRRVRSPATPSAATRSARRASLLRYDKTWTQEPLPAGFEDATSRWSRSPAARRSSPPAATCSSTTARAGASTRGARAARLGCRGGAAQLLTRGAGCPTAAPSPPGATS